MLLMEVGVTYESLRLNGVSLGKQYPFLSTGLTSTIQSLVNGRTMSSCSIATYMVDVLMPVANKEDADSKL